VPAGRELSFSAFQVWFDRHRAAAMALGDIDAHALFEEFRGVIGAQAAGPLSLPDYLARGTRQSLLAPAAREAAHTLFGRYRQWLADSALRIDRPREQLPGPEHFGRSRRGQAGAGQRRRTEADRRHHAGLGAACGDRAA